MCSIRQKEIKGRASSKGSLKLKIKKKKNKDITKNDTEKYEMNNFHW